jgi:NadR type nicotinamide-nucleotide adenylyltransferase
MAPLPRRICLIGPECTGKTVLGQRLARELGAVFVAEYAREYAEAHGNVLSAADVDPIARGQMANEDAAGDAAHAIEHIVLDTDLVSTLVYARHYYGECPPWIADEARQRRADLYLLMDTDIPWQSDSVRDSGDDAREDLFDAFRCALDELEARWIVISGTGEERWQTILAAVQCGVR